MSKITVFSAPNCPYCNQVKKFLDQADLEYEEINLGDKPEKAEQLVKKTGQMGVPVTIIKKEDDEKIIIGFNQEKLSKILDI